MLPYKTFVCFHEKKELLEHNSSTLSSYPIGSLLLAYLDINWNALYREAIELENQIKDIPIDMNSTIIQSLEKDETPPYILFAKFFNDFIKGIEKYPALHDVFKATIRNFHDEKEDKLYEMSMELDRDFKKIKTIEDIAAFNLNEKRSQVGHVGNFIIATHIFLEFCLTYPNLGEYAKGFSHTLDFTLSNVAIEFIGWFITLIKILCDKKIYITEFIVRTLDMDKTRCELDSINRLLWFQRESKFYDREKKSIFKNLLIDNIVLHSIDNGKFEIISKDSPLMDNRKNLKLILTEFMYSTNIYDLIFLEVEHMCKMNIRVRQCQRCGKYFIPFSNVSLFCSRPISDKDSRTCKDVGAITKFQEKHQTDEATKLFKNMSAAYRMRLIRKPEEYTKKSYLEWRHNATLALESCKKGELSYEEFEEAIKLLPIK